MQYYFIIYHKTYCHQTCQGGNVQQEAPALKVTWPFTRVVLRSWFVLIRFVTLEHKRLSRHQVVVLFIHLFILGEGGKPFFRLLEYFSHEMWKYLFEYYFHA